MPKESKKKKVVNEKEEEIVDVEMQDYVKHIGLTIGYNRKYINLTQEDLAEKVNCATNYIGQIERGERCPSLGTLRKIAIALGLSSSEILADVENKMNGK